MSTNIKGYERLQEGTRVLCAPQLRSNWAAEAFERFRGAYGTVERLKESELEGIQVLVAFDVPIPLHPAPREATGSWFSVDEVQPVEPLHYCASARCPGFGYRASDRPHPPNICREPPQFGPRE